MVLTARRLLVITYRFLPLLVTYARDRRRFMLFGSRRRISPAGHRERARTLRETLVALGPTYVKLGQLLSTRPDLLPPQYVDELERLQDRVPPATWAEARRVLEAELGPVDEAFETMDTDAILDTLVRLGTLSPDADGAVMGDVMELAIADARGEEIEQYRIQRIVSRVEDAMYEFPLRLPAELALVLRVATVVEGVCVTLDPEFDFVATATDYLHERGYLEETAREYVDERLEALEDALESSLRVPPKLERALDRVERDRLTVRAQIRDDRRLLDRLARRIVLGTVAVATIVSTAILYASAAIQSAAVAAVASLVLLTGLFRSFRSRRGIRARPQFTRQNLRKRRRRE